MGDKPDFQALEAALRHAGAGAGAAEVHGMLCGAVCARGLPERDAWVSEQLADAEETGAARDDAARLLTALHEDTHGELADAQLGFQPLLPGDGMDLTRRTRALAEWCGGFLAGLGLAGAATGGSLPAEVEEAVGDLAEIARADLDTDDPDEGDEAAYIEIVEYVRVAVLMINDALHPAQPPPPRLQ